MPKTKKSSTKKTAPKKKVEKKVEKKVVSKKFDIKNIKLPEIKKMESFKPALKILGLVVLIVGSFALIDLAVQYLNNDYSVAVVNGTRISRRQWHKRLEKAYGASVASQLIEDQIIKSEAKKEDLTVSKEEVDIEIDRIIESIGGEEMFNSALVANNITLEELKDQIKTDLLATKILAPTLEYTEEDVKEFFNQYSDMIFPEETAALEEGELLDFEKNKERTEEIYIQQQVQTVRSSWLLDMRESYRIQDNATAKPKYGFLTITTNIFNNLFDKLGDSSKE
jgi:hypothetical protein